MPTIADVPSAHWPVSAWADTGTVGRRPSGARLYHRGSRFGDPERRRLDRNLVARILFLAEALDRRTRAKGQHGGLLKGKGLDVLRALLRRFYSYRDGTCFPSYEAIAEAAGCCVETVRKALRRLEATGIVQTIRRKVVVSVGNRARRERYDFAVQTSNSYLFNFALVDRPAHGDLALPLYSGRPEFRNQPIESTGKSFQLPAEKRGSVPDAKFRGETSSEIKTNLPPALAAALERLGQAIDGTV